MSLYEALYGNPSLPSTFQCICGHTFRPEKDNETYCSTQCAREDTMRGLLGDDTLYKQNAIQQLHQARPGRRAKKVPSRLNFHQSEEERPPTPLPKSARHLPQNRKEESSGNATKVPPVPPLVLGAGKGVKPDIPPTPLPKSARHLERIPGRVKPNGPPPVPSMPSQYALLKTPASHPIRASIEHKHRNDSSGPSATYAKASKVQGLNRSYNRYIGDTPVKEILSHRPAVQPVSFVPREHYPVYVVPSQHDSRDSDMRRSASMPFLRRKLDPSTKLGAQYHPQDCRAIYAPVPIKPVIPNSPPPAYTSGGLLSHGHIANPAPPSSDLQREQCPAPIKTRIVGTSWRAPEAFLDRAIKQSRSTDYLSRTSSSPSTMSTVLEAPGDVWRTVHGLRTGEVEDYRDRFLNRATPRY